MEWTIKAILARHNGDVWEATKYCWRIAKEASNQNVKNEYDAIAVELRLRHNAKRAEGAHA